MSWLRDTPLAVVAAHAQMIDRLQAEEAMQGTTQVAIGHRMKPGGWMGQQWSRWKRVASAHSRASKALPADLGAVGIGLKVRS